MPIYIYIYIGDDNNLHNDNGKTTRIVQFIYYNNIIHKVRTIERVIIRTVQVSVCFITGPEFNINCTHKLYRITFIRHRRRYGFISSPQLYNNI